jgi:hypothetical protein
MKGEMRLQMQILNNWNLCEIEILPVMSVCS